MNNKLQTICDYYTNKYLKRSCSECPVRNKDHVDCFGILVLDEQPTEKELYIIDDIHDSYFNNAVTAVTMTDILSVLE